MKQRQLLKQMRMDIFKEKENKRFCSPDTIERLAKPKNDIILERLKTKQLQDDTEFVQQCTFKPEIGSQSKLLANIKYSQFEKASVVDRLNYLEQERQQHLEEIKFQIEEEQKEEKTTYIKKETNPDYTPVYKRIANIYKEKQQMLQNLQDEREEVERELYKFRPQINPQSEVYAMIKNEGEDDVVARLTKYGIKKQQRMAEASQQTDTYSFKPLVNENNSIVIQRLGLSENFMERQMMYQKNLVNKQMELIQEQAEKSECTFKPKIEKNSENILQEKQQRSLNFVERLYDLEIQKQADKKDKPIESQFPFKPDLCQKSLHIAQERSISDLFQTHEQIQKKEMLKSQLEEQLRNECSFYPVVSTNPKYNKVESQYIYDNCSEVIKLQQKEKEILRRQKQKENEERQLESCTFKPSLMKKKPQIHSSAQVKGMEKHLQQKDLLTKKKTEEQRRKEILFEKHKFYDYDRHQKETNPQPFNLTNHNRGESGYSKKK